MPRRPGGIRVAPAPSMTGSLAAPAGRAFDAGGDPKRVLGCARRIATAKNLILSRTKSEIVCLGQ
jgi:hypothetical protein